MAVVPRRGRARLRLALLVLTALVLVTLDFRGYGPLETAQSGVRDLLQPVVVTAGAVLRPVGDAWTATLGYGDLQRENAELKAEIDLLRGEEIRQEADRESYRRLREATGVGYIDDVERLAATVLRDVVGNFGDDEISIDKGRRDGVASGMAVVTGAGLAGQIDAVGANQSTVVTVSSPDLVIGVRLLDTGEVGLGHGVAGDPARFVVDTGLGWPETEDLSGLAEIGSAVVTSASSRLPGDIPVGRVSAVEPAEAGLIQVVTVDLAVDTRDLGFVTVLLTVPDDSPPTGPDSPFSIPSIPSATSPLNGETQQTPQTQQGAS